MRSRRSQELLSGLEELLHDGYNGGPSVSARTRSVLLDELGGRAKLEDEAELSFNCCL